MGSFGVGLVVGILLILGCLVVLAVLPVWGQAMEDDDQ